MDTLNDIISGLKWGNLDPIEAHDRVLLLFNVSGSLPSQELIEMLKECRDLLVMCSLIDKSGYCKSLVDKVDTKMGWQ